MFFFFVLFFVCLFVVVVFFFVVVVVVVVVVLSHHKNSVFFIFISFIDEASISAAEYQSIRNKNWRSKLSAGLYVWVKTVTPDMIMPTRLSQTPKTV